MISSHWQSKFGANFTTDGGNFGVSLVTWFSRLYFFLISLIYWHSIDFCFHYGLFCISVDLLSASATANISVYWKHEKLNEVKER